MKLSEIIKSKTVAISDYRIEKAIREFAETAKVTFWTINHWEKPNTKLKFHVRAFTQEDIFYHLCDTVGYVHFGYINPVFNRSNFLVEIDHKRFYNTMGNSVKGYYVRGTSTITEICND